MRNNRIWEPWSTARVVILLPVLLLAGEAVFSSGGSATAAIGWRVGSIAPSPVATQQPPLSSATATPASAETGTPSPGETQTPPTSTDTPAPSSTGTGTPQAVATATGTATNTPGVPTPVPTAVPTLCAINFTDVLPTDWFYEHVQWMVCHGFAGGYSDGTFRPGNNATRSQIAKIVVLAAGWSLQEPEIPTFDDVPPGSVFYSYVETAAAHQIISGYDDRTFKPGNNVTRGQLCKIIVLARGWPLYTPPNPNFTDVPPDSAFFAYVETAVQHAIVSGYVDNAFKPGNLATRAQLSKIVQAASASRS